MILRALHRPLFALAVGAFGLAGCTTGSGGPPASIPPGATGSIVPVTTATPEVATTPTPAQSAAYPFTLIDDEGRTVTLAAEPTRIVSLTPATTELAFAVGTGDRVVGKAEDISLYPPEAAAIPDVAKFGSVDVEKIVGLDPDLVIAGGNGFNPPDQIDQLRSIGIPVLVVYAANLEGVFADVRLVGRAMGRAAEADALAVSMTAGIDEVTRATRDLPRPRVYYELDATNGFFGPAPDYFGVEMIRLAGGVPLTSGTPGVFQIPAEKILAFDPEVILLGDAAYGVTPEAVASRPGWQAIRAVKAGEIRPIDDVVVTRPGPRLVEGLRALALAIHPDVALPPAP